MPRPPTSTPPADRPPAAGDASPPWDAELTHADAAPAAPPTHRVRLQARIKALLAGASRRGGPPRGGQATSSWPDSFFDDDPGARR